VGTSANQGSGFDATGKGGELVGSVLGGGDRRRAGRRARRAGAEASPAEAGQKISWDAGPR
jgi:hypothetical protein